MIWHNKERKIEQRESEFDFDDQLQTIFKDNRFFYFENDSKKNPKSDFFLSLFIETSSSPQVPAPLDFCYVV